MTFKRLLNTILLNFRIGSISRGKFMKKVFAECGDNIRYQIRSVPLYPELIKLGSNINVSSGVKLVTHDAIHAMYNAMETTTDKMPEIAQCIEIKDNVFIGVNCTILGNVIVGPNVIISANSLVNKDLEPGGIYGGVPAKRIGDFDAFWEKRRKEEFPTVAVNQHPTNDEIKKCWESFYKKRK